jgi:hypothetical protein
MELMIQVLVRLLVKYKVFEEGEYERELDKARNDRLHQEF